jgi:hypothetical protein
MLALGLLLAAGCTSLDGSGGAALDQVLVRADDTPGRQGYLHVAMVESAVAAQYAGLARAAGDDLETIRSALGEMVYALDPRRAPDWQAKSAGLVNGWAGRGYGVRRASERAAEELEAATTSGSASTLLQEVGPRARRCLTNTSQRADRLLAMGEEAMASSSVTQLSGLLPSIEILARELNDGTAGSGSTAAGCGLRQAAQELRTVVPPPQSS